MNCLKPFSLCVIILGFLILHGLEASGQGCFNSDFENGTLDGYTSFIGRIDRDGVVTINNEVISPQQHRVFFVLDGNDPIAEENCIENVVLPVVPVGGGAFAMRLGNSENGANAERVRISFTVTEENNFFLLNYAVLLNDPSHLPHEQPRFSLSITDSQGDEYPCGSYEVAAAANIENFENCRDNWKVRPWTSIGIELQSYLGEEINIEMSTNDCALGGHAGYAYLDATCKPLDIELFDNCDSNSVARMLVTAGFDKYLWSTGDTTSEIQIREPRIGDEYFVTVTSATGCSIVLSDTIPQFTAQATPLFDPPTTTTVCDGLAFRFRPGGRNLTDVYSVELGRFIDSMIVNNVTQSQYTFIAYSRSGCPQDTVTHYFNGLPYVLDSLGKTLCTGTDEGSITLSPLIAEGDFEYLWSTGDTTSTITDLRAGTYVVTVSNEFCDYVADYQVEQPDPISIAVDQDRVICRGYGAEATFSVSGGTSPYLYSYDGGRAYYRADTYTQFKEGNNVIYVRDNNLCIDSVVIFFPLVEVPEIVSYDIFQDSCGNPGNQIRVNQSTSGLPPYQYNVDFSQPFSNQTTFNDFSIGTHTLYVQDANECINRAEFEFEYYELFYIMNLDINDPTCTLSNGDVTVVTSQTDIVQYAIDNSPYQTSNFFPNLAPGPHKVYTINRNGCLLTQDFTLGPSFLPDPITTVVDNTCNGFLTGQINLSALSSSNPYTYQWSTGETTSSLSDLPDGSYEVTVTDSDGCVNRFSYDIVSPSALEMDVIGTFFSCQDRNSGEIVIDALGGVGGYSYSIDGGASFRVDNFFLGVGSGQYEVQVKDRNSCIKETTITVEDYLVYDDIQLDMANDTCAARIGALSIGNILNGVPPYRYAIDGSAYQTSPEFGNLTFGDYSLYVEDGNGCIWEERFQIDSLFSLHITADVINTTCEEDNGVLEVFSTNNYDNLYYLNGNLIGSDSLLTELSFGSYQVLVENRYGCTDFIDVQIVEGVLPQPTDVVVNNDCYLGKEGSITLENPFGSPAYTYEWSNGEVSSSITDLGIGNYAVTVTNTDDCQTYLDFDIIAPEEIVIDIEGVLYNCPENSNGEIRISSNGGFGSLQFSYDGGLSYSSDTSFMSLPSDTYLIRVQDENLCVKDTMIEVADYQYTEDINLVVAMDTCMSTVGAVVIENRTKNVSPFAYSLDGNVFQTDTSFLDLTYGEYILYIEDGNGCVWNQPFRIDTVFSVNINAQAVDTECDEENGRIIIDVSSEYENRFYLNASYAGQDAVMDSLPPSDYMVMVINEYGCSDSVSVAVMPSTQPIIDEVDVEYFSCQNNDNSITIYVSSGNPPFSYAMDDNLAQSMNAFSNLDSGTHVLKVLDDENCSAEMEFIIEVFEPIEVEYDFENPACDQANGTVMLEARGGAGPLSVIYDEYIYAAGEMIEGLSKGSHTFEIVDTTDCSVSLTLELEMQCKYYIPNTFSPDNDGINDAFEIFFSEGSTPIIDEFSIYDRWGEVVARQLNVDLLEESISWDGRFNNKNALPGVYTYILSGQFESGEQIYSQGTLTLVK